MTFPRVTITSFEIAQQYLLRGSDEFDAVLSLNDVNGSYGPPDGFEEFRGFKLALFFDDAIDTSFNDVPPEIADAEKIIAFARAAKDRILIHCGMGISRSTAAAIAIPAIRLPSRTVHADSIMRWLREVRPIAKPNPLLVQMVDSLTGWNGRLSKARNAHFPASPGSRSWI